jgi:hypothetical protein
MIMLTKRIKRLRIRILSRILLMKNHFSRRKIITENGPVVSMTSYGSRIESVWLTIESIAAGRSLPARIILWIDDASIFNNPPVHLRRLQARGLEIKLTDHNYGPHNKYYHYLEMCSDFREPLITADDDIIYPRHWLSGLVNAFASNAAAINCYRAKHVIVDMGIFQPYETWPLCTSTRASYRFFATGVSGVIYPPLFLNQLKGAKNGFVYCCPKADDIWLHLNAIRNGWKIKQIFTTAAMFDIIPGTQHKNSLFRHNVLSGGNDIQIRDSYNSADIRILESC